MSKLTIVAHITLNPEKIDYVKTEMAKMFPITRSEKGCLQYDLHQDNENPDRQRKIICFKPRDNLSN